MVHSQPTIAYIPGTHTQARLFAELFVPNFTKRITTLLSAGEPEEVESANSEFGKGLQVSRLDCLSSSSTVLLRIALLSQCST